MRLCSTYYSFCGNAGKNGAGTGKGIAGEIRSAVCSTWLKPIDMREHPTFSSWVIYGTIFPTSLQLGNYGIDDCYLEQIYGNCVLSISLSSSLTPNYPAQSPVKARYVCPK